MIGYLKGKLINASLSKAVVEVGGVGYLLHSTPKHLGQLSIQGEAEFWVHTAVRENDISLYGFGTEDELCMFEMLLTVSGIGPKSALTILGVAGVSALEEAISSGVTAGLTKMAGVSKKTADKIVLELGGKLSSKVPSKTAENADVFDAFKSLGYRDRDIVKMMEEMPKDVFGVNEKIKWALKNAHKIR